MESEDTDKSVEVVPDPKSADILQIMQNQRKVIVVGDYGVGKSTLVHVFSTKTPFSPDGGQMTFGSPPYEYVVKVEFHRELALLGLFDHLSRGDNEHTRHMFYSGIDVVLLCFSLADRSSLESLKEFWIPEVRSKSPNVPMILVGTKSDLPSDRRMASEEGERLAEKIKAVTYLECSATDMDSPQRVFKTAAGICLGRVGAPDEPKGCLDSVCGSNLKNIVSHIKRLS